ncbi:hypothetical protein FQN57_003135 [Myotisia sp. PD_48]|nr:hypothetical protein FQN57_003135 [Myotisia sp. PD_48]
MQPSKVGCLYSSRRLHLVIEATVGRPSLDYSLGKKQNNIKMSTPSSAPGIPPQPRIIRYLYDSALLLHAADTYIFYTGNRILFPDRTPFVQSAMARYFLRNSANLVLPFALNAWLLRGYHIRKTHVGRVVGSCFLLYHVATLGLISWSTLVGGEYELANVWGIWGLHAIWAGVSGWGLLRA